MSLGQARADTGYWNITNGTPGLWSTAANWWTTATSNTTVSSAPTTGQNAFFTGGIATPYTTSTGSYAFFPQLGANVAIASFQFNTGSSGGVPSNSTLLLASSTSANRTLTFSAGFSVNNGVLTLADTVSLSNGGNGGNIAVANTPDSRALLMMGNQTISMSGNTSYFRVGNAANASGGVTLKAGSTITNSGPSENRVFVFGTTNGTYGGLNMPGGTITSPRLTLGGDGQASNDGGLGVAAITGGTLNISQFIILNRIGVTGGGILTLDGGTINHAGTGSNNLYLGFQNAGLAELNVLGGALNSASNVIAFGNAANFSGTGTANVNGGAISTRGFTVGSLGTYRLNFNGGVLSVASGGNGTFLPSAANLETYVNGAFGSFAGGAIIDTNGQDTTVSASLVAPSGDGVSTIAVTDGGSGYVGAPRVVFSGGGGTGATAVANMVDDGTGAGTYRIGSITVTNPGVNYSSSPTVTLDRGGFLTAATVGTVSTGANTSGGLTKRGAGTLTLTGNNTYSGGTVVDGGTLTVGAGGTLGVSSGSLAVNNPNTGAGTDVVLNLATAVDTTTGSLSGTLAAPSSGTNTATINMQTGRTFTVSQTSNGTYAGVIAGAGDFVLGGLSTSILTLAGNNTYTGTTTVSAGTLVVNGSLDVASAVTVGPDGSLSGTGTINGPINFDASSLFHIADINDPLSAVGTVTFGSGFGIANISGVDWDAVDLNTPFTILSTTQTFTSGDIANLGLANAVSVGTGRSAYFQSGSLQLVVVPEPATFALAVVGLGGIAYAASRRRRS
jgi:autotransporter-associated beta strand protein